MSEKNDDKPVVVKLLIEVDREREREREKRKRVSI